MPKDKTTSKMTTQREAKSAKIGKESKAIKKLDAKSKTKISKNASPESKKSIDKKTKVSPVKGKSKIAVPESPKKNSKRMARTISPEKMVDTAEKKKTPRTQSSPAKSSSPSKKSSPVKSKVNVKTIKVAPKANPPTFENGKVKSKSSSPVKKSPEKTKKSVSPQKSEKSVKSPEKSKTKEKVSPPKYLSVMPKKAKAAYIFFGSDVHKSNSDSKKSLIEKSKEIAS